MSKQVEIAKNRATEAIAADVRAFIQRWKELFSIDTQSQAPEREQEGEEE